MGEAETEFCRRLVGQDAAIFLDRLSDRQISIITRAICDQKHDSPWFRRLSNAYIQLCMKRMGEVRLRKAMAGGSIHVCFEEMLEALDEEKEKTKNQFEEQRRQGGAGILQGNYEGSGGRFAQGTAVLRY